MTAPREPRVPHYYIKRHKQDDYATLGRIFDDGGQEIVVTLEPPPHATAGHDAGCIPAGEYEAERYFSPEHQRTLWRLNEVPGRTEIEMHAGCLPRDTKGCILVGSAFGPVQYPDMDKAQPGITGSKSAMAKWMTETQNADRLRLSISNPEIPAAPGEFA